MKKGILRFMTPMVILALLSTMLALPSPVQAATITVTTTEDIIAKDEKCSLREAIIAANTNSIFNECDGKAGGHHIIMLEAGKTYELQLVRGDTDTPETGDLDINAPMTIMGDKDNRPIINAKGIDRVFHIDIPDDGAARISGVVIEGGKTSTFEVLKRGGGIYVEKGKLALDYVTIQSNISANVGGGIYINGPTGEPSVTIVDSIIRDNSALHGGGIYNYGTLIVYASSLIGNTAAANGGALGNGTTLTAQLYNTTITQNTAQKGAGIYAAGKLVLHNSTIADNFGIGLEMTAGAFNSFVNNTIIARQKNGAANCKDPISNALRGRRNLADDTSCSLDPNLGDKVVTKANLKIDAAPESHGSYTLLYATQPGSLAVGGAADCPEFDQRWFARRKYGCDIGSYEMDLPYSTMLPIITR
jgi:CSLREA domain-containing protein